MATIYYDSIATVHTALTSPGFGRHRKDIGIHTTKIRRSNDDDNRHGTSLRRNYRQHRRSNSCMRMRQNAKTINCVTRKAHKIDGRIHDGDAHLNLRAHDDDRLKNAISSQGRFEASQI